MAKLIKKEEATILWTDDPEQSLGKSDKKEESPLDNETMELHIRPEKKGRGGKTVTVIYNFPSGHSEFKKLTKKLKRVCGSGGTFKGDSIEVQGDHREQVKTFLESLGYKVKFTGG